MLYARSIQRFCQLVHFMTQCKYREYIAETKLAVNVSAAGLTILLGERSNVC